MAVCACEDMLAKSHEHFDEREWRRESLDAAGRAMDGWLRSPAFLKLMKDQIDALIHTRKIAQAAPSTLWDRFLCEPPRLPRSQAGATPCDVVYKEGSLRLLRYRNDRVAYTEPVLICFALVNRPYVMDLQSDRSVVRQFLRRGLNVYLIDWGEPTHSNRTLRLHDYICRFLKNAADVVCEYSASHKINLLGYCMGGTMSAMYAALYQKQVRNLILMATPIDFSGDEGLLNLWAREEYFDVDGLIDAFGNCPGEFLQCCFQLMRPAQNFVEKQLTLCEKLDDHAFLQNFVALERWANDSIPVAGETFREFVKLLYQQNRLVKGEMKLQNKTINLGAITCPLLLLVAQQDHLTPPNSTLAIEKHIRSDDVKTLSIDAGHIGLAVSSKAHRRLWPDAVKWTADHSTPTNWLSATTGEETLDRTENT